MIYCVRFEELVVALARAGFFPATRTESTILFRRDDGRLVIVRAPNISGHLPEAVANDAFDAAGLEPPAWDVFWCD